MRGEEAEVAHCSGFEASLADRMQAIDKAGLTAEKTQLAARTFMVNWDNRQELVEEKVRDTTVRIAQAAGRVDEHQKPPEVNEATSHPPGGELVQAGMTAEPLAKQETTEDEADAITAALEAKLLEFVVARALGDKPTDEALVSQVLADMPSMPINCKIHC